MMLTNHNIKIECIREAIRALGLLEPEAETALMALLQDNPTDHPKKFCTEYRKKGSQLSKEEKKEIGLRANSFMSVEARSHLTEKGIRSPIVAHETTLLRASFTLQRYRSIRAAWKSGSDSFKYYPNNSNRCRGCRRLAGALVKGYEAEILPPSDCDTETCNLIIQIHFDFIEECFRIERCETITLAYQAAIEALDNLFLSIRDATPQERGAYFFKFHFTCMRCGSDNAATNNVGGEKYCYCTECKVMFGKWSDVEMLARCVGTLEAKRLAEKGASQNK